MNKIKLYVAFAVTAALMLLIFPLKGKFAYQYQKGSPWIYETLISKIDFPILKTDAEIQREKEAKASQVIDCYVFNDEVERLRVEEFEKASTENGYNTEYVNLFTPFLSKVLKTGLVSGFDDGNTFDKVILVSRDKRVKERPADDVYTVNQALTEFRYSLSSVMSTEKADSLIHLYRPELYFTPNLVYDSSTTQLFHKEAVNYISPSKGIVYSGQLIVSNGEMVTADIEQMLDSYKAEYEKSFGIDSSVFIILISHLVFVLIQLSLLALCIYFLDRRIFQNLNKMIFILLLLFIQFAATSILSQFSDTWVYVFPYAAIALYLFSFFNNRVAFPVYFISLLPILVICQRGIPIFFAHFAAGSVALLASYSFNSGWKQFLNAFFIFLAMSLVYISFRLISSSSDLLFKGDELVFMAISSVLVVMFYPFAFLFEKMFSLVSHSRLWELSDTNSTLLREMARLAPGTFQHSMQVANLAEEATRQVGGYPMLARVGALYHDIGKIENPMCFVENQIQGVDGSDYHKDLSPEASARDIIRHVEDGLSLARKYSLPEVVTSFINTHHGRTVVRFFYNTWCNNGGDPSQVDMFKYNGMLPQTKEQAILMMADSIEAASRTLKNYNQESISLLVDKIVEGKMAEDQFSEADITLREIGIVKETFKTYLQQIYHARISYPQRKKSMRPEAKEQK